MVPVDTPASQQPSHQLRRPLIMGVVNVTPDSFSDGGMWLEPDAAIEHGHALIEAGADLIDVGGESTRPGARRPEPEEELRRVLPVVRALADAGHVVSIDTMRAEVADAALEAGARLVNDVSGGLADPGILGVVGAAQVPFVAMHWRAHATDADTLAVYDDVVTEVVAALQRRVEHLVEMGVDANRIILDPGFGFSKNAEHNWRLLARLRDVVDLGHRVLVGTSRKRFLGRLDPARGGHGDPVPAGERDHATAATSLLAAQAGCWAVRVHRVEPTRDALAVWDRVRLAAEPAPSQEDRW